MKTNLVKRNHRPDLEERVERTLEALSSRNLKINFSIVSRAANVSSYFLRNHPKYKTYITNAMGKENGSALEIEIKRQELNKEIEQLQVKKKLKPKYLELPKSKPSPVKQVTYSIQRYISEEIVVPLNTIGETIQRLENELEELTTKNKQLEKKLKYYEKV